MGMRWVIFISVCMVLLLSACSKSKAASEGEISSTLRPMIYVQDTLFGDTSDVTNTITENAVNIGTIEKVVSQKEPMERTNFTSNLLRIGSEIYYDETDSNTIYVKLPNERRYSIYITIE